MNTRIQRPVEQTRNPNFSSGPCAKRPGWTINALADALVGRSHRAVAGKAKLALAIERTKALLELPDDYLVAIVPGSDTGAFEMALWSMLGARGVDALVWESFGRTWVSDIVDHLRLPDVRLLEADFGELPDLASVDFARDVVFTWNGTTSGVRVPDADWIPARRQGLTFVDATSAIFAQAIDWAKTDVVTFSWQKALGGEAAHGMLILSPRAVERLETFAPAWPLPKLFRLTKGGMLDRSVFAGHTINTPSMLCVEDYLDGLAWARSIGGLPALMARADANARVLHDWIAKTPWIANLAIDPKTRSNTSVCLRIVDADIVALPSDAQIGIAKRIVELLDQENVAKDIGSYRDAPAGLRVWTGPTVDAADLERLTPWLDWAFDDAKRHLAT